MALSFLRKYLKKVLKKNNSDGFSIIELSISMVIMTIIGLGIATLIQHQSREVKILSEKLIVTDVKTHLTNMFSNKDFCSCVFRNRRFNSVNLSLSNPWNPSLTAIPNSYINMPAYPANCTQSGVFTVPTAGNLIPNSNLQVESLQFRNTASIGVGDYTSNLTVNIEPESMVMPLKSISVPIRFSVDTTDPANARSFLSCTAIEGSERLAFFNQNLFTLASTMIDTGPISCLKNRAFISFGGRHLQTHEDTIQNIMLFVNDTIANSLQSGGRVSSGNLTNAASSIHGSWLHNCSGTMSLRLEKDSSTNPGRGQVDNSYITVDFVD